MKKADKNGPFYELLFSSPRERSAKRNDRGNGDEWESCGEEIGIKRIASLPSQPALAAAAGNGGTAIAGMPEPTGSRMRSQPSRGRSTAPRSQSAGGAGSRRRLPPVAACRKKFIIDSIDNRFNIVYSNIVDFTAVFLRYKSHTALHRSGTGSGVKAAEKSGRIFLCVNFFQHMEYLNTQWRRWHVEFDHRAEKDPDVL